MTRHSSKPPAIASRASAIALFIALTVSSACSDAPTAVAPAGAIDIAEAWAEATPASVGIDESRLPRASAITGSIPRMRSLLVVREGRLVHEAYFGGATKDTLADVRSVTKSVVATLAGIALNQGHIDSLDQSIADFLEGPEFELSAAHHLITIRHLLTMTSGFSWDESGPTEYRAWMRSENRVSYPLQRDIVHEPGTTFEYNSSTVFLLGIAIEKAVGRSLPEYADEVLFGPLGIRERRWEELREGYVNGGAGIDLRPRDLARFGQLYLQKGWSGDESVVPDVWIDQATFRRFEWTSRAGPIEHSTYSFLWWIDLSNDAYFAWGFGGQFVYVVPRLELVVVATTDWRNVDEDIGHAALQELVLGIIVNRIVPAAS